MTMAMVRSGVQSALRRGARTCQPTKRSFSSSSGHDDAYELTKWVKKTSLGAATCTALAVYLLSKGHHHYDEPPAYLRMHIRNKEFPCGPDRLFEVKNNGH